MTTYYIQEVIDDGMDEPNYCLTSDSKYFNVPRNALFMNFGDGTFFEGKRSSLAYIFAFICSQITKCVEENDNLECLDFSTYPIYIAFCKKERAKTKFCKLLTALSKSSNFKIIAIREDENDEVKKMIEDSLKNTDIKIENSTKSYFRDYH